ncbi:MAG: bifunctional DNA primase/polymerase [Deltaproteobacteria bacterium]|nr:bifunctional DNA primase/polymerase [Deltaproteobacteria bacterium]
MNTDVSDEELQTINEVCNSLSISRSTVYSLMREGVLPYVWLKSSRRIPSHAVRALARTGLPAAESTSSKWGGRAMALESRRPFSNMHWTTRTGDGGLPAVAHTKKPLTRHGYKDATTDEWQIRRLGGVDGRARNVGIATGGVSGKVVLDVDPRKGGDESLGPTSVEFDLSLDVPTVHTGGGGEHYFFQHPGDQWIPCRTNLAGYSGLDIKADGGTSSLRHRSIRIPAGAIPGARKPRWTRIAMPVVPDWLIALQPKDLTVVVKVCDAEPWDGRLSDAVARTIALSPKIHQRFHRDSERLTDQSDSVIDYSSRASLHAGSTRGRDRGRDPIQPSDGQLPSPGRRATRRNGGESAGFRESRRRCVGAFSGE